MPRHLDLDAETIARLLEDCREGRVELVLLEILKSLHRNERIMNELELATAAAAASITALRAEVSNLNAKVDALIVLAQNAGVPQADIDAVKALGAAADAGTADVQAEEAKVDAALNPPAPPPAPDA